MTSVHDADLGGEAPCWMHLFHGEDEALSDIPAGARPDLDSREHVECFVREFYRLAAVDDLLGPIFHAARVDWQAHLATLTDFWSWQLLGERGYDGNPLRAHEPAHAHTPFRPEHYERWLELFDEVLDTWFAGPHVELARTRAHKMARALARLLDGESAPGEVPVQPMIVASPPGGRLSPPG